MNPTDEQQAIFEFVHRGSGNLIVEALAGAGKTSTALESLKHIPQRSVLFCAFNKRNAVDLEEKMPPAPKGYFFKAQTFHAIGLGILKSLRGYRFEVDPRSTEQLVNEAAAEFDAKVPFAVRRAAVRLLRTCKETCTDRAITTAKVEATGHNYNHFAKLSVEDIAKCARIVVAAYIMGADLKRRASRGVVPIDFVDMTWLPVVLEIPPPNRYQAVFVDEAQDLSLPQLALVKKMIAPNGRIIAIGDRNQEIYDWRGAVGSLVWKQLQTEFKAETLPLSATFRCARAIVKQANVLVPSLRPREGAAEGEVRKLAFHGLAEDLQTALDAFVLSRTNADLLMAALTLWSAKVNFQLAAGKEIVEPLYEIIDRLDKKSKERFSASLVTWFQTEMGKAERAHAAAWADRVEQQHAMLSMMLAFAEPAQFKQLLADILANENATTVLSTVHKAKGLEADRVYLLKQTFARHKPREVWMTKPIEIEELNIEYVAITRARAELVWVDMPDGMDLVSKMVKIKADDLQTDIA